MKRFEFFGTTGVTHGSHDDTRGEDDIAEEEEESQRRRKRAKKSHLKDSLDEGVYHSHPLSVIWHIFDEVAETGKRTKLLTLRFEYLTKLNIVCAGIEGDQGSPLELLTNLFPNDTGLELPTQVTYTIQSSDCANFWLLPKLLSLVV